METTKEFSNEIDEALGSYKNSISIRDGLSYSQKDIVKRIDFYSLSEYLSGGKDGYGRRKPFLNQVNQAVDITVRATDYDIKSLQLKAEGNKIRTLLLKKAMENWFRKNQFGKTLNELNEIKVRYGGVLAKKSIKDGELIIQPVTWANVVTDQIDIESGIIIERYWLSPQEIRRKADVWNNTEDAIKIASKNRGKNETGEGTTNRVEILEVEGEFPIRYFDENVDEENTDYALYIAVMAIDGDKKILLYSNEKKQSSYKYLKRKATATSGRSLGMGVVEEGFQAQISINEAAISERLAFEIGGKIIAKTNAKSITEKALTQVEDGSILELEENEYFESAALLPSNMVEYQNIMGKWMDQYQQATSTFSSVSGEEGKSATPFRSLALQSKLSAGNFDYEYETFGFFVEELLRDWVLPEVSKDINKEFILEADFTNQELKNIDEQLAIKETNNQVKDRILGGQDIPEGFQEQAMQANLEGIKKQGLSREFSIPKDYFKDLWKKLTIITTDQQLDRRAEMQTLFDMWSTMQPGDPNKQILFEQMTELSGSISPMSLNLQSVSGGRADGQVKKDTGARQDVKEALPAAQQ